MIFEHPFARLVVTALVAVVVTVSDAAAQGSYRNASLAAIAASQGKTIGQIDTCNDHPNGLAPAPGQSGSLPAGCTATAASGPGTVIATSSTNASLSAGGGGGSDRFGRPLFSSISLVVKAKSKVEFKGAPNDPLGGSAGGTAIARVEIVVETGTPYMVTLMPSGNAQLEATMNSVAFSGSVSRTTSGILDVRLTANSPDVLSPGPGADIDGTVNVEVTFGSIPPIGACCRASCFVDTSVACNDAAGVFKGGGTTCNPNPCVSPSASPVPTATPSPNGIITWINPAGGAYGTAGNWSPPQVPTVTTSQADTAVFNIDGSYGLNVAGATAKRFIIRNSSIDLVGGTASVTSTVPSEPSLVIGQNGKLHLVSGSFTSVDSVLGDVSGGLAEVDLISGAPSWSNTGRLTIGDAGPGRLTVVSGQVTSGETRIGGGLLGPGEAIVGGPGEWTAGDLGLGFGGGSASLEIRDRGIVVSTAASIGVTADAEVTATGGGWTSGNLAVGRGGVGTLTIEERGKVVSDDAFIGLESVPGSSVTVDGTVGDLDTTWTVGGRLVVGAGPLQQPSNPQPDATLDVVGGGYVETQDLEISGKGDGKVTVAGVSPNGTPSLLAVGNVLVFGGSGDSSGGQGVLSIVGGADVHAKQAKIGGFNFGALGVVGQDADGEASRLHVDQDLFVGVFGGGLVQVFGGGLLESDTGGVANFDAGRNAIVLIGTPAASEPTSAWRLAGNLDVGSPQAQGEAAVVVHASGAIVITGGGAVRLQRTGLLAGGGRVQGDVTVMGGQLAPLDLETRLPTRLAIDGDLRVDSGTVRIVVAGTAPGFFDVLAVSGGATLGGTLEIVFANGFVPQSGDTFPFLQVSGAVTGSFAQVSLVGVQQGLPFSLTPSGIVIGSLTVPPASGKRAAASAARANATVLVLTTLADGVACAIPDATGDGVAECETCDNCLDDNANQLVDGADPDCVLPADGGGAALAAPAHRKALVACGKVLRTAAAKLAQGVRKGLTACAAAVATCGQQKPDDPECVPKAIAACAKKTAKLRSGAKGLRETFAAKVVRACSAPALELNELLAANGLGFAAAAARCARFGIGALDGIDALVECVAREAQCRATALLSDAVPHLASLAATGGVSPELLACAGDDAAGSASGNAGGKALRKCQTAIATAAEKLDKAIAGAREACAASVLACRQLGADPAACTAKAAAKCRAAAAKLGDPAAGTGAGGKVAAAIGKACAAVPLADLLGADGLGFGGQAGECAARGVPVLTSSADVAGCLSRRVACRTGLRLEAATPRLHELLELGQTPLP